MMNYKVAMLIGVTPVAFLLPSHSHNQGGAPNLLLLSWDTLMRFGQLLSNDPIIVMNPVIPLLKTS